MDSFVKWTLLTLAGIVALALIAVFLSPDGIPLSDFGEGFAEIVGEFIETAQWYIMNARGALNQLAPPLVWDIFLYTSLLMPFTRLAVLTATAIQKWIYK